MFYNNSFFLVISQCFEHKVFSKFSRVCLSKKLFLNTMTFKKKDQTKSESKANHVLNHVLSS